MPWRSGSSSQSITRASPAGGDGPAAALGDRRRARRCRRRRCARRPRALSASPGGPNAICTRLRQRTRSDARAWSRSCVAIRTPRPSEARSRSSVSSRSALAPSSPANGSSSSSSGASCTSARATRTRWRCPPERSPKVVCARSSRPTRRSASCASVRSPRLARRHHGSRETAPISATSSALTGKSRRERSVCGTRATRPAGRSSVPPPTARSPVSTRNSVDFPPPLGPRTAIRSPAQARNVTLAIAGTTDPG